YFVIATGRTPRQTASIWDEVHARLKEEERLLPQSVDGTREGEWIVADYLDVVLHVFTPDARSFYRLEELVRDVPAADLDAAVVGRRDRRGLARTREVRGGAGGEDGLPDPHDAAGPGHVASSTADRERARHDPRPVKRGAGGRGRCESKPVLVRKRPAVGALL